MYISNARFLRTIVLYICTLFDVKNKSPYKMNIKNVHLKCSFVMYKT
jgi:hypothetical protein